MTDRALSLVLLGLSLAACERADDDTTCPAGTTLTTSWSSPFWPIVPLEQFCEFADGTRHGPVVYTGRGGGLGRGRIDHGRKDGHWSFEDSNVRSESDWNHGVRDGWWRSWLGGRLVFECRFREGRPDGPCDRSAATIERMTFVAGRRAGIWRSYTAEGALLHVRMYGDDILLARDGRPLPPPPESMVVGGKVVRRADCRDLTEPAGDNACTTLFEAW